MAAGEQQYIFRGENTLTFPKQNCSSTYVGVSGCISQQEMEKSVADRTDCPSAFKAGRSYSYGKKHFSLAKACVPILGSFCVLSYSRAQQLL